jgi:hypothetical protein
MLEMILLSIYQSGWVKFWVIISRMLLNGDDFGKDHPAKVFCSMETEGSQKGLGIIREEHGMPVHHFKFQDLFFGVYATGHGTLEKVLVVMRELQEWNETTNLKALLDDDYKMMCVDFCDKFEKVCKCEMGELRLQVLIDMLVLTGMVKRGHNIVDRSYPVEGHPSYQHLVEYLEEDQERDGSMTTALHFLGNKLGIPSQAVVNNICGQSIKGGIHNTGWEVFFRGQSLYKVGFHQGMDGGYAVFDKPYGERNWRCIF